MLIIVCFGDLGVSKVSISFLQQLDITNKNKIILIVQSYRFGINGGLRQIYNFFNTISEDPNLLYFFTVGKQLLTNLWQNCKFFLYTWDCSSFVTLSHICLETVSVPLDLYGHNDGLYNSSQVLLHDPIESWTRQKWLILQRGWLCCCRTGSRRADNQII